jgi:hypothetical protein
MVGSPERTRTYGREAPLCNFFYSLLIMTKPYASHDASEIEPSRERVMEGMKRGEIW